MGESVIAGRIGVGQTVFTRVLYLVQPMVLPPLVMMKMAQLQWWQRHPKALLAFEVYAHAPNPTTNHKPQPPLMLRSRCCVCMFVCVHAQIVYCLDERRCHAPLRCHFQSRSMCA